MPGFLRPWVLRSGVLTSMGSNIQGPVARSLVSANRWLRGIKMYRFPWYLTLVSTNHASSNPGQEFLRLFHLTFFSKGSIFHYRPLTSGFDEKPETSDFR